MSSSITGDRLQAPGYGYLAASRRKRPSRLELGGGAVSRSHIYWIATVRPDSRPHVMPVWGVWLDEVFYFSSGRQSKKIRNLATNAHCVVSVQDGTDCVIVEGEAKEVPIGSLHASISSAYLAESLRLTLPNLGNQSMQLIRQ